jgi:hypothetical protein
MPSIRQTSIAPARTLVVHSAGAVPAPGSVPTSGAPGASGTAGKIAFHANVLVAGHAPIVARGAFPRRLAETIAELIPNSGANSADIAIGVAPDTDANDLARIGQSFTNRTGTWISIDGAFTAYGAWQLANLNHAIARALANNITFAAASDSRIPARDTNSAGTAGTPLLEAFNRAGACTGTRDFTKVYAAACTRWAPLAQNAITPGATTQPPAPQGTLTPIAQSASEPALCSFVTASRFWLRPSPTFERVGPEIPAGTRVDLMDATSQTQGTLRLYDVRVAATQTVAAARAYVGRRGWAAMSAADVASCASVIAARDAARRTGGTVPKPVGTPGASTGGGNTAIVPVAPATPAMRPESTTRPGQVVTATPVVPPPAPAASSSKTPYIVGGALVLTAGVMYWQRDAIRKMFK